MKIKLISNSIMIKIQKKDREFSDEKIIESLEFIMENNSLFSMSSLNEDNSPWINTAFYSYDSDFNLFFLTPPTTLHSENVKKNKSVAVSIYDSHQLPESDKRGLQIFGTCHKASLIEIPKVFGSYAKRFQAFSRGVQDPKDMIVKGFESRFYIIKPHIIKIFDEVLFGEEEWVTIEF
jgi:uncharacterized protein YhbP (UPF0306 family)